MRRIVQTAALLLPLLCLPGAWHPAKAQGGKGGYTLEGRVRDAATGAGVPGATLRLDNDYRWAVTDTAGNYRMEAVAPGQYTLQASCLGYADGQRTLTVPGKGTGDISLQPSSLALEGVVVTAELSREHLNTTQVIGQTALEHLQAGGLSDISTLLPGGHTVTPDLTQSRVMNLRANQEAAENKVGNAAFATAVEVDGVRLGGNAAFGEPTGVDTRAVATENIASVEVLSGVPSAEYGDLGSGIVRVHTKKGRTPATVTFSANPRTLDLAASKGFDLPWGTLNVSAQWTRATHKLTTPDSAYTRRNLSAVWTRALKNGLRFEAGLGGNLGGMQTQNDPDKYTGEFTKARDNQATAHAKAIWNPNRPWMTQLRLEGSAFYHDKRRQEHRYFSTHSPQPAVHAEREGYYAATLLPTTYFADKITDSRELDFAASLNYVLSHKLRRTRSVFKAGVQWKSDGNVGLGEYYEDPLLAKNGYRPRPYRDYPRMHNLAVYAEENFTFPVGKTTVKVQTGLRWERVFVRGTQYTRLHAPSPRLNLRWDMGKAFSLRGGWGIARKLPSFYVLFPVQKYRDIQSFSANNETDYIYSYYTQTYSLQYNPNLRWQTHHNAEVGADLRLKGGFRLSVSAFLAKTKGPYEQTVTYAPFQYNTYKLPDGYSLPKDFVWWVVPTEGWVCIMEPGKEAVPMDLKATLSTFSKVNGIRNGAPVMRKGIELTADFPEIRPLRTSFRLDGSFVYTFRKDTLPSLHYAEGVSHPTSPDQSFPYVGIYAGGGGSSVVQGKKSWSLSANLTAITRIPAVRLVVTCRVEATLLRQSQNLSDCAFTVGEEDTTPTGKDVYAGDAYTAVYPVAYMDTEGKVHPWTSESTKDEILRRLIVKSSNTHTFARDGYAPYVSANLNLTKEIGDHVSLSFFANNFTCSSPWRKSLATGVYAQVLPEFYYGISCRLKL